MSTSTREGRVLQKLFDRVRQIEQDLDPQQTGKVFNVLGDVFPANQLERMVREMYAHNLTEKVIKDRIVEQVDTEQFRRITHSALEGLAKRELNLAAIVGKSAEAKERRLVPEVIEDFFVQAGPLAGLQAREVKKDEHVLALLAVSQRAVGALSPRHRQEALGRWGAGAEEGAGVLKDEG